MPALLLVIHFLAALMPADVKTDKGILTFDQHTIKLGDIYPGERYERVFTFKNTGTAPIVIEDIETACGCTVVKYSKEPVMPGKQGEIKVDFVPKDSYGFTSKSFVITSNAEKSPDYLYLQANVVKKNKK